MKVPHSSDAENTSGCCNVVVPVHRELTDTEMAALLHNVRILKSHDVTILGPDALCDYLDNTVTKNVLRETEGTARSLCLSDSHFVSIDSYNQLMISQEFYDQFADFSYILICQVDCLIIQDHLDSWTAHGYSFVGAPVFDGYSQPNLPYDFTGELNGGLSLRKISDCRRVTHETLFLTCAGAVRIANKVGAVALANQVLRLFGKTIIPVKPGVNEDVIWTSLVPRYFSGFTIPTPMQASRFAFEAAPEYLLECNDGKLPFGCHAFQRYGSTFWRKYFPDEYFSADR